MKILRKITSVILVLMMVFFASFSAFAADESPRATEKGTAYKALMNVLDGVVSAALKSVSLMLPTPQEWKKTDPDDTTGLMPGTEEFLRDCAENARFSLGYDQRSLLDGMDVTGKAYVTGSLSVKKKLATEIEDDLKVRTVAVSDATSRGITLFLVLDAYGLSLPDVRVIREKLADFIEEKNIVSVNVSVLHQHSAVDTFGMNGDIFDAAFLNPARMLFGQKPKNGKDGKFMSNLYEKCVESAKSATENMTPGALYYGTADQTKYLRDKRAPYVFDNSFNRFRFVPDNGEKETWLVSTEIHCVGNGVSGTIVTGDYPYYAEKEINESAGANVLFYMGAQQGTTHIGYNEMFEECTKFTESIDDLKVFGRAIGRDIAAVKDEKEVEPLLNITHKQITLPVENPILLLGGKAGIFEAKIAKTGFDKYSVVSEIGYMELGKEFAFVLVPGEISTELVSGGCLQGSDSWSGGDWKYPSLQQIITEKGKNRRLMAFDLCNDQISYIIPDNNYIPLIAEESKSLELVSLGRHTGSAFVKAFEGVVK